MKQHRQGFTVRAAAAAIRGALLGIACMPAGVAIAQTSADEPTAAQLTTPTQSIEIGVGAVSQDSPKAGEYDGLQRRGAYGVGNFDLRGGGAYDANDATRWRLSGTNLGLETRDLRGEYGEQGTFRAVIEYDELLRNGSAVYPSIRTPYQGVGGTSLTLPGNWQAPLYPTSATMSGTAPANNFPAPGGSMLGLAATGYGSPLVGGTNYLCKAATNGCAANPGFGGAYTTGLPVTPANTALLAQNLTDLNDFQSVRLSTKRDKLKYGALYELGTHWEVSIGMQREDKRGLKPLGVVNSSGGGYAGENAVIIPEVIDTTTDQYNASLSYRGERSFATLAYSATVFQNNAPSMTLANPYGVGTYNGVTQTAYGVSSATISEEPNSTFNQVKLTGGYNFTPLVKLVADASYGRNAQNAAFVVDPAMFSTPTGAAGAAANNGSIVPVNSANALVINESLDLKLTARPLPQWNLDAAYKLDNRDNKTPINTYVWYDDGAKNFGTPGSVLNGASVPGVPAATPLYGGVNVVANRPYSKRVNDFAANADYAFAKGQAIKAGIDWQWIDRGCNGTWIDCAASDTTRETTGKLEYRYRGGGTLSGRVGLDYGSRHVDYNANSWMSLNPALGATNIPGLAALGYTGSVLGFLGANGLTPYGLPIPANGTSGYAGNTLAIYKLLFGSGNGGLSNNYYGNANVTQNLPGLEVYNMATRERARLRGSVQWQASDALTLQSGLDLRHDNYPDSTYGLEKSGSWALNFDADFAAADDLTFGAYYTHEEQRNTSSGNSASNGSVSAVGTTASATGTAYNQVGGGTGVNTGVNGLCAADSTAGLPAGFTPYQVYNNNAKTAPCDGWQSAERDRTDTIGLAFKAKHFVVSKLSISGDVSFSRALSLNSMTGGFYYANPLAAYVANSAAFAVPAVSFINAQAMPDVVVNALQLRLAGGYQLTKESALRVAYTFKHLQTNDYTYATTLPANTSGSVMPAFAPAPDYNVSIIGVSYVYMFQ